MLFGVVPSRLAISRAFISGFSRASATSCSRRFSPDTRVRRPRRARRGVCRGVAAVLAERFGRAGGRPRRAGVRAPGLRCELSCRSASSSSLASLTSGRSSSRRSRISFSTLSSSSIVRTIAAERSLCTRPDAQLRLLATSAVDYHQVPSRGVPVRGSPVGSTLAATPRGLTCRLVDRGWRGRERPARLNYPAVLPKLEAYGSLD